MKEVIHALQKMMKRKIISSYAVGGAMGLTFYSEPTLTFDLDIFVFLVSEKKGSSLLVNLESLYKFCRSQHYNVKQEHVMIGGIAVQFIPAYNALVEEAIEQAQPHPFESSAVRVFSLAHLMAIMLQTGRPKDHARLVQVVSEKRFNRSLLQKILKRHDLLDKWTEFQEKYGAK